MSTTRTALAVAVATAAVGAALLAPPGAQAAAGKHDRADSQGLVARIHQSVQQYQDPAAARIAGYRQVGGCEESPTGGMGMHFLNPEYGAPGPVDPEKPTILLYGPDGEGGLRLLGVEYWQPFVGQPTPTLGGEPFDGPMPGHTEDMPVHYDLHVWTEVANPDGVFAPWNPRVSC